MMGPCTSCMRIVVIRNGCCRDCGTRIVISRVRAAKPGLFARAFAKIVLFFTGG